MLYILMLKENWNILLKKCYQKYLQAWPRTKTSVMLYMKTSTTLSLLVCDLTVDFGTFLNWFPMKNTYKMCHTPIVTFNCLLVVVDNVHVCVLNQSDHQGILLNGNPCEKILIKHVPYSNCKVQLPACSALPCCCWQCPCVCLRSIWSPWNLFKWIPREKTLIKHVP